MSPFIQKLLGTTPKTSREKSAVIHAAKAERTFNLGIVAQAQANIDDVQNKLGLTKAERDEWWKSNYSPVVLASIQARHQGTITHEQIAENQLAILEGKKRKFTAQEKAWLAANKWDVRKLHELNAKHKAPAPLTKTKHGFLTSKPAAKAAPMTKPTAPANPLAAASDNYLIQAATHRSAPEAGKAAARAELVRRGFTISPDGKAISRSQRGGRAVRLTMTRAEFSKLTPSDKSRFSKNGGKLTA